ncbi:MAG: 5-(carboxyamino)imidazole ribonucleotide mutase [Pseudomonadota bacterium]
MASSNLKNKKAPTNIQVGVIMGSQSDWNTMQHAVNTLEQLGVVVEARVVSAHRTPDLLFEYAKAAQSRGLQIIIAGAGGAAHLPGMVASQTSLPVLGVPIQSHALNGMDSLLSIVQMPAGVPVGTLAIGRAGAVNAGLLAAAILALHDKNIEQAFNSFRQQQTQNVLNASADLPKDLPA